MTHEQAIPAQDVVRPLHFVDTEQQSHVPVPLARISTCGLITVEVLQEVVSVDPPRGRYRVLTPQQIRGRGAVPALMLLKLLVSRPHRFATKDWLATHLQDEMDMGALVRLDTIASYLRKMLCGMEGFDDVRVLLVAYLRNGRGSGPGYQLAESPFVWLDTDALRFQVEHAALMERMGEPDAALPFWECAVALGSRGTYLADDPFSEWAEDQRGVVVGLVRQSVQSLYRLCMKKEDEASHAHALLLLRTYWQAHKTDEDALRPLLEHLGKHERYQEAEEYYQQCVAALDEWENGRLPDPRTQDMREFLRTKQLVRERVNVTSKDIKVEHISPLSVSSPPSMVQLPNTQLTVFPQMEGREQGILVPSESGVVFPFMQQLSSVETTPRDIATWIGIKVNNLKARGVFWHEQALSSQQTQSLIHTEIETWSTIINQDRGRTNEYLISRRTALATLATLSSTLLTKMQFGTRTLSLLEEFLAEATTSIVACWHLLRGDGLATVEYALPKYLPLLIALIKHHPAYKTRASYLASQGFLLLSLVALHQLHFPERVEYCKQAVEFARESGDCTLLIASLLHLGDALFTNGQKEEMIQTYSQAEYQSKSAEISMFLRSKVLAELAHAYAQQGRNQESLRSIGEAHALFTEESSDTPVFLSTDYGLFQLILFEGLSNVDLGIHEEIQGNTRLAQEYYQNASDTLKKIDQLSQTIIVPERIRVEIVNQQALAAVQAGNLDEFGKYLLEGAKGAKSLASEKRRQEAIANWKRARKRWPQEKSIGELADVLF